MPGSDGARCGSLASSGLPVSVWSPATTQELRADARRPSGRAGSGSRRRGARARSAATAAEGSPARDAATQPRARAGGVGARTRRRRPRRRSRSAGAGRTGTAGRARRPGRGLSPRASEDARSISSLHVAAQVPRHRLEPGDRVDRGPRLGRVVGSSARARRTRGDPLARCAVVEIGVDALGVGLRGGAGLGRDAARAPSRPPGASPSVRRNSSVSTWSSPNISESRPEVTWRRTSIS